MYANIWTESLSLRQNGSHTITTAGIYLRIIQGITPKSVDGIVEMLAENQYLSAIDLSDNDLRTEGLKHICRAISVCQRFESRRSVSCIKEQVISA